MTEQGRPATIRGVLGDRRLLVLCESDRGSEVVRLDLGDWLSLLELLGQSAQTIIGQSVVLAGEGESVTIREK